MNVPAFLQSFARTKLVALAAKLNIPVLVLTAVVAVVAVAAFVFSSSLMKLAFIVLVALLVFGGFTGLATAIKTMFGTVEAEAVAAVETTVATAGVTNLGKEALSPSVANAANIQPDGSVSVTAEAATAVTTKL